MEKLPPVSVEPKLQKLIINTELSSLIELEPSAMGKDIYDNIKLNLKRTVVGECNRYGFVQKINQIMNIEEGQIYHATNECPAVFRINYNAQICIPVVGVMIVARLVQVNKSLLKLTHGPIVSIVKIDNYNSSIFTRSNDGLLVEQKSKKNITVTKFYKIIIEGIHFHTMDKKIFTFARLHDSASEDEVKEYYTSVSVNDDFEI